MVAPTDPRVRVSDAERDQVLDKLRDGFVDGRLTDETFADRADAALRARFGTELRTLVADLPSPRRLSAEVATACRQAVSKVDRWLRGGPPVLRGGPPVLQLPRGSQHRFTIGRDWACDMMLANETVSRWHASLEWDGYGWLLDDLGSTNGTRLNGWRVSTPCRVAPGDLVSFGAASFVLADHRL